MTKAATFLKIILRICLGLILTLAILIACAALYLTTDHAKHFAKTQIHNAVNSDTMSIDIESIDTFFPLSLRVSRLSLKNPDTSSLANEKKTPKRWLHLKNLTLYADISNLLSMSTRKLTLSADLQSIDLGPIPQDPEEPKESEPLDLEAIKKTVKETLPFDIEVSASVKSIKLDPSYAEKEVIATIDKFHLSYDVSEHMLHTKLSVATSSFGKPLDAILQFDGPLDNFDGVFVINSESVEYQGITIDNIKVQGSATGLPFDFKETMRATFSYQGVEGAFDLKSLTMEGDVISIEDLYLKGLKADVKLNASYNLKSSDITSSIKGKITSLEAVSRLIGYPLGGSIDLEAKVAFTTDQKTIDAKIHAENLDSADFKLSVIDADIDVSRATLDPDANINIVVGPFQAGGIEMDETTLSMAIQKGIGKLSALGKGDVVSFDTKAELKLATDSQSVRFETLKATYMQQPIAVKKPFTLDISGNNIVLSPVDLRIASFPILVSGQKSGDNLDFNLKAEADLTLLSQLFLYTGDIVAGMLTADLKIQGQLSDPKINGFVDLKNGDFESAQWGTKLHDMHIRAVASGTKIAVENVKANDGHGGQMSFDGHYDLKSHNLDMLLKLVDFRLAHTDALQVEGREGQIKVTGNTDKIDVKGKLKTGDIAYDITKNFASDTPKLNVIDPNKPNIDLITGEKKIKAAKPNEKGFVTFNIAIEIPPTVRVFGMGLDSKWGGELKITGTEINPLVIGNINADSGGLSFLGNDVKIEKGLVRFDGYEDNLPFLSMIAGLQKRDYKVIISVSGRASKPTFELKSEPSKPQDEIIANLLFDTDKKELSPFDAVKLATTVAQLGGLGSGASLSSVLQSNKKIDKDKDSKGNEKDGKKAKENYKSDKRFSDFVKVDFDQGATPSDSKVLVDVQVSPSVTISSETGAADSSQSLGIKYRWDY